jgi:7,8-dihydropterin-6-yl-methyl-4-(beta-D-ribofuranosyl)aminobenzene 5'-phosphate synthase
MGGVMKKINLKVTLGILFFCVFSTFLFPSQGSAKDESISQLMRNMVTFSIPFIENQGQANERVKYYANTFAGTVYVMVFALKQNQQQIAGGTPFYVGEEAFLRRYSLRPGTTEAADLGQLKKEDIENLGLKVVEVKQPTQIIPGGYFTGNIERITAYEKVPPTLLVKRGEKPEPDDFRGEQSLFFNVKGKGLVVISGCAHAGIVNTVKHAQKVTGTDKVHAVMGGFHLANAKPEVIGKTVADIKATKPDYIMPMHCTGFETMVAFAKEMPNEFILNTAGTKYTFSA